MIEAFKEFLDNIYWSGYSEQLKEENPKQFRYEYEQFKLMYSENVQTTNI